MNRVFKFLIISLLLVIGLYGGYVLAVNPAHLVNHISPVNATYATNGSAGLLNFIINSSTSNFTANFTGRINTTNGSSVLVQLLMQLGGDNGSRASNNSNVNGSILYLGTAVAVNDTNTSGVSNTFSIVSNKSLPDGNHTWYFNASIANAGESFTSNMSGANFTIVIDNSRPLLAYLSDTETNNSNLTTRDNIAVNVSVYEWNIANVTIYIQNGSAIASGNTTPGFNKTTFAAGPRESGNLSSQYMNFSLLADGNYTLNVTTTDLFNQINRSGNRIITIDTTVPVITHTTTPTDALLGDIVTLVCTATDNLDGSPVMSLELKRPTQSSYTVLSSQAQSAYKYATIESGTHSVRCTATDYAGKSTSSTKTFAVAGSGEGSADSGGAAGGSSGSRGSGGEVTPEEVVPEEQAKEVAVPIANVDTWETEGSVSYTDVSVGKLYTFEFVDATKQVANHTIEVTDVNEEQGYVIFLVQSDAQEVTVLVGEGKEVDLDQDGFSDLLITVNGITAGVADVSFAKVGTWREISGEEKGLSLRVWVVVAVLVLSLGLGTYWYFRRT